MTDPVVVRSSSVEAAKLLVRRNAARGRATDPETTRLATATYVPTPPSKAETNGSHPDS